MKKTLFLLLSIGIHVALQAQEFQMDADLRIRYEHRNGYGEPRKDSLRPANFAVQRTRIILNYANGKTKIRASPQSVRVWGESPQGSKSDVHGLQMYEAWIQYEISPAIHAKAGRQELNYDDARILGNADWNMQARSHDALLLAFSPKSGQHLHLGAALNAQRESNFQEVYTVKNQYKNMQFLHYTGTKSKLAWSLLFLNQALTNADNQKTSINQTFGGRTTLKYPTVDFSLSAFGQTGKREGKPLNAYLLMVKASWKGQWKPELGLDYISGKGQTDPSSTLKSFTPWYGTNHKFNGYMDYFYVGNHQNSVGLIDVYGQVTYATPKWKGAFSPHYFWAAAALEHPYRKNLGLECDLTLSYQLAPELLISSGYSFFHSTNSLKHLRGEGKAAQHWLYISLQCSPKLLNKG